MESSGKSENRQRKPESGGVKRKPIPKASGPLFTIPRLKKIKRDLLTDLPLDSHECQHEILSVVRKSFHFPVSNSCHEFIRVQAVHNSDLTSKYLERRKEMKSSGYSDPLVMDTYAFIPVDKPSIVEKVCKEGVRCGNQQFSGLGVSHMAVHVCKHADILTPSKPKCGERVFLVVKVLKLANLKTSLRRLNLLVHILQQWCLPLKKTGIFIQMGKIKTVLCKNVGAQLEPTPNYDCHIAKPNADQPTALPPHLLFYSSQLYVYEYGDFELLDYPRQVLPYAVVYCNLKEPQQSIPKTVASMPHPNQASAQLPQAASTSIASLRSSSSHDIGPSNEVWRGRLHLRLVEGGHIYIEVSMLSYFVPLTVNLISPIKVHGLYPEHNAQFTFFYGLTNIAHKDEVEWRAHYFRSYLMRPMPNNEDHFKALVKHISAKREMPCVKLADDVFLFLMPNCLLASQLGLVRRDDNSPVLHCVLMSKFSTSGAQKKKLSEKKCDLPNYGSARNWLELFDDSDFSDEEEPVHTEKMKKNFSKNLPLAFNMQRSIQNRFSTMSLADAQINFAPCACRKLSVSKQHYQRCRNNDVARVFHAIQSATQSSQKSTKSHFPAGSRQKPKGHLSQRAKAMPSFSPHGSSDSDSGPENGSGASSTNDHYSLLSSTKTVEEELSEEEMTNEQMEDIIFLRKPLSTGRPKPPLPLINSASTMKNQKKSQPLDRYTKPSLKPSYSDPEFNKRPKEPSYCSKPKIIPTEPTDPPESKCDVKAKFPPVEPKIIPTQPKIIPTEPVGIVEEKSVIDSYSENSRHHLSAPVKPALTVKQVDSVPKITNTTSSCLISPKPSQSLTSDKKFPLPTSSSETLHEDSNDFGDVDMRVSQHKPVTLHPVFLSAKQPSTVHNTPPHTQLSPNLSFGSWLGPSDIQPIQPPPMPPPSSLLLPPSSYHSPISLQSQRTPSPISPPPVSPPTESPPSPLDSPASPADSPASPPSPPPAGIDSESPASPPQSVRGDRFMFSPIAIPTSRVKQSASPEVSFVYRGSYIPHKSFSHSSVRSGIDNANEMKDFLNSGFDSDLDSSYEDESDVFSNSSLLSVTANSPGLSQDKDTNVPLVPEISLVDFTLQSPYSHTQECQEKKQPLKFEEFSTCFTHTAPTTPESENPFDTTDSLEFMYQNKGYSCCSFPSISYRYESNICFSCCLYKTCIRIQNVYLCTDCKLAKEDNQSCMFVQLNDMEFRRVFSLQSILSEKFWSTDFGLAQCPFSLQCCCKENSSHQCTIKQMRPSHKQQYFKGTFTSMASEKHSSKGRFSMTLSERICMNQYKQDLIDLQNLPYLQSWDNSYLMPEIPTYTFPMKTDSEDYSPSPSSTTHDLNGFFCSPHKTCSFNPSDSKEPIWGLHTFEWEKFDQVGFSAMSESVFSSLIVMPCSVKINGDNIHTVPEEPSYDHHLQMEDKSVAVSSPSDTETLSSEFCSEDKNMNVTSTMLHTEIQHRQMQESISQASSWYKQNNCKFKVHAKGSSVNEESTSQLQKESQIETKDCNFETVIDEDWKTPYSSEQNTDYFKPCYLSGSTNAQSLNRSQNNLYEWPSRRPTAQVNFNSDTIGLAQDNSFCIRRAKDKMKPSQIQNDSDVSSNATKHKRIRSTGYEHEAHGNATNMELFATSWKSAPFIVDHKSHESASGLNIDQQVFNELSSTPSNYRKLPPGYSDPVVALTNCWSSNICCSEVTSRSPFSEKRDSILQLARENCVARSRDIPSNKKAQCQPILDPLQSNDCYEVLSSTSSQMSLISEKRNYSKSTSKKAKVDFCKQEMPCDELNCTFEQVESLPDEWFDFDSSDLEEALNNDHKVGDNFPPFLTGPANKSSSFSPLVQYTLKDRKARCKDYERSGPSACATQPSLCDDKESPFCDAVQPSNNWFPNVSYEKALAVVNDFHLEGVNNNCLTKGNQIKQSCESGHIENAQMSPFFDPPQEIKLTLKDSSAVSEGDQNSPVAMQVSELCHFPFVEAARTKHDILVEKVVHDLEDSDSTLSEEESAFSNPLWNKAQLSKESCLTIGKFDWNGKKKSNQANEYMHNKHDLNREQLPKSTKSKNERTQDSFCDVNATPYDSTACPVVHLSQPVLNTDRSVQGECQVGQGVLSDNDPENISNNCHWAEGKLPGIETIFSGSRKIESSIETCAEYIQASYMDKAADIQSSSEDLSLNTVAPNPTVLAHMYFSNTSSSTASSFSESEHPSVKSSFCSPFKVGKRNLLCDFNHVMNSFPGQPLSIKRSHFSLIEEEIGSKQHPITKVEQELPQSFGQQDQLMSLDHCKDASIAPSLRCIYPSIPKGFHCKTSGHYRSTVNQTDLDQPVISKETPPKKSPLKLKAPQKCGSEIKVINCEVKLVDVKSLTSKDGIFLSKDKPDTIMNDEKLNLQNSADQHSYKSPQTEQVSLRPAMGRDCLKMRTVETKMFNSVLDASGVSLLKSSNRVKRIIEVQQNLLHIQAIKSQSSEIEPQKIWTVDRPTSGKSETPIIEIPKLIVKSKSLSSPVTEKSEELKCGRKDRKVWVSRGCSKHMKKRKFPNETMKRSFTREKDASLAIIKMKMNKNRRTDRYQKHVKRAGSSQGKELNKRPYHGIRKKILLTSGTSERKKEAFQANTLNSCATAPLDITKEERSTCKPTSDLMSAMSHSTLLKMSDGPFSYSRQRTDTSDRCSKKSEKPKKADDKNDHLRVTSKKLKTDHRYDEVVDSRKNHKNRGKISPERRKNRMADDYDNSKSRRGWKISNGTKKRIIKDSTDIPLQKSAKTGFAPLVPSGLKFFRIPKKSVSQTCCDSDIKNCDTEDNLYSENIVEGENKWQNMEQMNSFVESTESALNIANSLTNDLLLNLNLVHSSWKCKELIKGLDPKTQTNLSNSDGHMQPVLQRSNSNIDIKKNVAGTTSTTEKASRNTCVNQIETHHGRVLLCASQEGSYNRPTSLNNPVAGNVIREESISSWTKYTGSDTKRRQPVEETLASPPRTVIVIDKGSESHQAIHGDKEKREYKESCGRNKWQGVTCRNTDYLSTTSSQMPSQSGFEKPQTSWANNQPVGGKAGKNTVEERRNRRQHPYVKTVRPQPKESRQYSTFNIPYKDLRELMECLTTSSFRSAHKRQPLHNQQVLPNPGKRFADYSFQRSSLPVVEEKEIDHKNLTRPEDILDYDARRRMADMVEELAETPMTENADKLLEAERQIYSENREEVSGSLSRGAVPAQSSSATTVEVLASPTSESIDHPATVPISPVLNSTTTSLEDVDLDPEDNEDDIAYKTMDFVGELDVTGSDIANLLLLSESNFTSVTDNVEKPLDFTTDRAMGHTGKGKEEIIIQENKNVTVRRNVNPSKLEAKTPEDRNSSSTQILHNGKNPVIANTGSASQIKPKNAVASDTSQTDGVMAIERDFSSNLKEKMSENSAVQTSNIASESKPNSEDPSRKSGKMGILKNSPAYATRYEDCSLSNSLLSTVSKASPKCSDHLNSELSIKNIRIQECNSLAASSTSSAGNSQMPYVHLGDSECQVKGHLELPITEEAKAVIDSFESFSRSKNERNPKAAEKTTSPSERQRLFETSNQNIPVLNTFMERRPRTPITQRQPRSSFKNSTNSPDLLGVVDEKMSGCESQENRGSPLCSRDTRLTSSVRTERAVEGNLDNTLQTKTDLSGHGPLTPPGSPSSGAARNNNDSPTLSSNSEHREYKTSGSVLSGQCNGGGLIKFLNDLQQMSKQSDTGGSNSSASLNRTASDFNIDPTGTFIDDASEYRFNESFDSSFSLLSKFNLAAMETLPFSDPPSSNLQNMTFPTHNLQLNQNSLICTGKLENSEHSPKTWAADAQSCILPVSQMVINRQGTSQLNTKPPEHTNYASETNDNQTKDCKLHQNHGYLSENINFQTDQAKTSQCKTGQRGEKINNGETRIECQDKFGLVNSFLQPPYPPSSSFPSDGKVSSALKDKITCMNTGDAKGDTTDPVLNFEEASGMQNYLQNSDKTSSEGCISTGQTGETNGENRVHKTTDMKRERHHFYPAEEREKRIKQLRKIEMARLLNPEEDTKLRMLLSQRGKEHSSKKAERQHKHAERKTGPHPLRNEKWSHQPEKLTLDKKLMGQNYYIPDPLLEKCSYCVVKWSSNTNKDPRDPERKRKADRKNVNRLAQSSGREVTIRIVKDIPLEPVEFVKEQQCLSACHTSVSAKDKLQQNSNEKVIYSSDVDLNGKTSLEEKSSAVLMKRDLQSNTEHCNNDSGHEFFNSVTDRTDLKEHVDGHEKDSDENQINADEVTRKEKPTGSFQSKNLKSNQKSSLIRRLSKEVEMMSEELYREILDMENFMSEQEKEDSKKESSGSRTLLVDDCNDLNKNQRGEPQHTLSQNPKQSEENTSFRLGISEEKIQSKEKSSPDVENVSMTNLCHSQTNRHKGVDTKSGQAKHETDVFNCFVFEDSDICNSELREFSEPCTPPGPPAKLPEKQNGSSSNKDHSSPLQVQIIESEKQPQHQLSILDLKRVREKLEARNFYSKITSNSKQFTLNDPSFVNSGLETNQISESIAEGTSSPAVTIHPSLWRDRLGSPVEHKVGAERQKNTHPHKSKSSPGHHGSKAGSRNHKGAKSSLPDECIKRKTMPDMRSKLKSPLNSVAVQSPRMVPQHRLKVDLSQCDKDELLSEKNVAQSTLPGSSTDTNFNVPLSMSNCKKDHERARCKSGPNSTVHCKELLGRERKRKKSSDVKGNKHLVSGNTLHISKKSLVNKRRCRSRDVSLELSATDSCGSFEYDTKHSSTSSLKPKNDKQTKQNKDHVKRSHEDIKTLSESIHKLKENILKLKQTNSQTIKTQTSSLSKTMEITRSTSYTEVMRVSGPVKNDCKPGPIDKLSSTISEKQDLSCSTKNVSPPHYRCVTQDSSEKKDAKRDPDLKCTLADLNDNEVKLKHVIGNKKADSLSPRGFVIRGPSQDRSPGKSTNTKRQQLLDRCHSEMRKEPTDYSSSTLDSKAETMDVPVEPPQKRLLNLKAPVALNEHLNGKGIGFGLSSSERYDKHLGQYKKLDKKGVFVATTSSLMCHKMLQTFLTRLELMNKRGYRWTLDIHMKSLCEMADKRKNFPPTTHEFIEISKCRDLISKYQLKGLIRFISQCSCRKAPVLELSLLAACSEERRHPDCNVVLLTGSMEASKETVCSPGISILVIQDIDTVLPPVDM